MLKVMHLESLESVPDIADRLKLPHRIINDLIDDAARLLGRHVAARVTFMRGPDKDFEGAIEDLTERAPPGAFMSAVDEARRARADRGVHVNAREWLAKGREE